MKPSEPIDPPVAQPTPASPLPDCVHQAGTIILVAGLLSAVAIYLLAGDSAADAASAMRDTRQYDYQVQRLGGDAGLMIVRFNAWLGSLWHGTRLAYTVGALSLVVGLACHKISALMAEVPAAGEREGKRGE